MELAITSLKDAGLCLWDPVSRRVDHVRNLKENLNSLEVAIDQLNKICKDVEQKVENGERIPQMKRTNQVSGWLDEVKKLADDASRTLQDGRKQEQNKCLGGFCPKNCLSSYKLGKIVSKKLAEVKEKLHAVDQPNDVVQKVHDPVEKIPMAETVGLDSRLQIVCRCIEDRSLGIIGLYGIPGVGKTTLLNKINNKFLEVSHDFDEVILISVTKLSDVEMVQRKIMDELDLPRVEWSPDSRERNARKICRTLDGKKFLLLLDDIWQKLDLEVVGVPRPNDRNQSKVVFTTRTIDVCGIMGSQRNIEVQCLQLEEAWQLFQMWVGQETLDSDRDIPNLARIMAEKCNGLPLALKTVGGTMASRKGRHEWEYDKDLLINTPGKFEGMRPILELLKFSYDKLQSPTLKDCFLYCCLFPENYDIKKDELIEHWIGEGLLDDFDKDTNIKFDLRLKGEKIIESLKRAGLLGNGESEEFIRMHGLVREMAWKEWEDKVLLLIKSDGVPRGLKKWKEVERMSLWDHSIQDLLSNLKSKPHFEEGLLENTPQEDLLKNTTQLPNLRTMICKDPMSRTLHATFFSLMSSLKLLDLSNSSALHELPTEIGCLINLEYLNVSNTSIPELPSTLKNLRQLRCLILNYTKQLQKIPSEMISNFQSLEVFNKLEFLQCFHPGDYLLQCLLEELECLQNIREICIAIHEATSLQKLLGSDKLLGCIRKLTLDDCSDMPTLELSPSLLRKMEDLELRYCNELRELKISPGPGYFSNLSKVVIKGCSLLSDVSWLIYAQRLQTLELVFCKSLGEIIGDTRGVREIEENIEIFSSLLVLRLECLPKLESICRCNLPFPSLIKIEVQDCQLLTKLPFDSNSASKSLEQINGEGSWWDSLHWDDEVKKNFSPKFVDKYDQNDWVVDF